MNDWLYQELLAEEYRYERMRTAKKHNSFSFFRRSKLPNTPTLKSQQLVVDLPLRKKNDFKRILAT